MYIISRLEKRKSVKMCDKDNKTLIFKYINFNSNDTRFNAYSFKNCKKIVKTFLLGSCILIVSCK